MKIWIIGSKGMLGSYLLALCQRKRIEVVGTSHLDADITDLPCLLKEAKKIRPSHIINCAAYTDVDGAEKNPHVAFAVNALGAAHVAQVAKLCGTRLIHISTDYVFNGKGRRPYREIDACDPINTYGKSKREGEVYIFQINPKACLVRTSWLFGLQGKNLISSLLKWLLEKEELKVVFDQWGKPTYCPDLAEAVLRLLDAEGIVHFANDSERSRYQMASEIKEMASVQGYPIKCRNIIPVSSEQFPTLAKRPAYTVLDTTQYFQKTKQQPRPWETIIKEYLGSCKIEDGS